MGKRLFAGLMTICMLLSVMPATVHAEEGTAEVVCTENCTEETHVDGCPSGVVEMDESGQSNEDGLVEVATYDELVAALENGGKIKLTADITVDQAITVPDETTIDMNGKTIYLNVENSYFGNATIKNEVTDTYGFYVGGIVLGKDDVHVCDGYFLVNPGTTLTMSGLNVTSSEDGIKGYAVFHLKEGANLDLEDCVINVANNEYAGSIFYAGNTNSEITMDYVEVTGENIGRGFVYGDVTMTYSYVTLTGTTENGLEHGFNGSNLVVNDSDITISGGSGRGITLGRSETTSMTVTGDSTITITDMDEATIKLSQATDTLTIAETATVKLDAAVTNTANGNVEAQHIEIVVSGLTGEGTEESPYRINNLAELEWFRDDVDAGNQYTGQYIQLTADIDLAGINWEPIGSGSEDKRAFQGTFDGGNHTIQNLYIEKEGSYLGFFAATSHFSEGTVGTVIKNVNFENVTVKSTNNGNYIGGVIANSRAWTTVNNVHVTGNIDIAGRGYIGGIIGHGYPKIDNCSVIGTGSITSSYWCCGGIIGYGGEGGTVINNCTVEGTGENGLIIETAAGGAAAICGLNAGPATGSNLSASKVNIISTGAGGYNPDYCLGYVFGNGEEATLDNMTVENLSVEANGKDATVADAVAKVGNKICFTLSDALAQGGTIELLRDITTSEIIKIEKEVIFDGQGKYTVTGTADKTFEVYKDAAFENITIVNNNNNNAGCCIAVSAPADIIVNQSTLNGGAAISMNTGSAGSEVHVTDSTFNTVNHSNSSDDGFGAIVLQDDSITVNVNGSSVINASATGTASQVVVCLAYDPAAGAYITKANVNIGSSVTVNAKRFTLNYRAEDSHTFIIPAACAGMLATENLGYKTLADGRIQITVACDHNLYSTKVVNVSSATCTAAGHTGDTVCSNCNTVLTAGTSIAAKGHSFGGYSSDANNHWKACGGCGSRTATGGHTFKVGGECNTCGYQKQSDSISDSTTTTSEPVLIVPAPTTPSEEVAARSARTITQPTTDEAEETTVETAAAVISEESLVAATALVEETANEAVVEAVKETVTVTDEKALVTTETIDKVIEKTEAGAAVILPLAEAAGEGKTVKEAEVPVESLEKIAEAEASLKVQFEDVEVIFDEETLHAIAEQAEGSVIELRVVQIENNELKEEQQAALEGKDVQVIVTAQIYSNGKYIGDFMGGTATLAIPFEPEGDRAAEDYAVYYVADNGDMTFMVSAYTTGYMIVQVDHFSDYVIVYEGASAEEAETPAAEEPVVEETTVEETAEEAGMPILPIIIIVVAVIAAVVFFVKKKNDEK